MTSSKVPMNDNTKKTWIFCSLLALQFGLQPMITSRFTPAGVSRSSVVIATEVAKIVIAMISVFGGPAAEREKIRETWTLSDSLKVAALPATLYAIQNLFVQYGYIMLDSMTFNLLNQTKTLSAALWLYLLLGQAQSPTQMFALFMLLVAAVLLNLPDGSSSSSHNEQNYHFGVLMVAAASMISGLSAALTQRALVGSLPRHSIFFSAELAVYGIIFLVGNLYFNSDIKGASLFSSWDVYTFIPVLTSAFGGIVVGQVTKYAGGVVKGFALIVGIIITGVAQWLVEGKALGGRDVVAVVLVSVSIYLHSKFPIVKKVASKPDQKTE